MKKNQGITLIALIITIIVMLILVAVSVNILVDSDLIGAAEKTADKYKTEYEKEGNIGEITIGGVKYDSIEDYINDNPSPTIKIKLSMTNKPEEVTAGGNVSAIKEGAPIPTGFYYVGGTLNTGVVISDAAADENTTNTTVSENLTGNQFVWVPVLQNQKLKIEVTSEEEITSIKLEDPLFREIELTAPSGKSYTTEITPSINGIYTVTVTAGKETIEKTLKVSSLYAQDFQIKTIEELKAENTLEEFTATYSEEGVIQEEWLEEDYGTTDVEEAYEQAMQWWYEADLEVYSGYTDTVTEAQKTSVNNYGGFYIARYEAGTDTARTESGSSDVTATVYSKKNMYPYNWISQENAITKSATMYSTTSTPAITSVTSALPNAAAWDRTLNWLVETKAVTEAEVTDSTSWGNYSNSYVTFTGKYGTYTSAVDGYISWDTTTSAKTESSNSNEKFLLGTGITNYTRRNNIYDLAGNCWEWTTEVDSSGDVLYRGGDYGFSGELNPASSRYINFSATFTNCNYSFRPVLYINQ